MENRRALPGVIEKKHTLSKLRRNLDKKSSNEVVDSLPGLPICSQFCILLFKSGLSDAKKIASLHKNEKDKSMYLKAEELIQVLEANPKSFIAFYNLNKVTTSLQVVSNTIEAFSSSAVIIQKSTLDANLDLEKNCNKSTKTKYLTLFIVNRMQTDTLRESRNLTSINHMYDSANFDKTFEKYELQDLVERFDEFHTGTSSHEEVLKFKKKHIYKNNNLPVQDETSNIEEWIEKIDNLQEFIVRIKEESEIIEELQKLRRHLETSSVLPYTEKKETDEEMLKYVADEHEHKESTKETKNEILRTYKLIAENLKDLIPTRTPLLNTSAFEAYRPMIYVHRASRKAVPPFARRPLFSIKESKGLLSEDIGIQFSNDEVMLGFLTIVLKEIHPKKIHNRSNEIPKRVHMPEGENFQHLSLFDICGVSPLLKHVITHPTFQEVDGMESMMNRLASFKDWPRNAPVSALRLVDSGFYLDLQASAVACYYCKLHIQTEELAGELNDNSVLNMHLRLSENCPHALKQKHDKDQALTESFRFSLSKERNTVGTDFFRSVSPSPIQKNNLDSLPEPTGLEISANENLPSMLHLSSNYEEANKTLEKDNILATKFNSQTYLKENNVYGTQTNSVEESHLDAKQGVPIQTKAPDSLNIDERTLHPNSLFGDQNSHIFNGKDALTNPRTIVAETMEPENSSIFKSTEEDLAYSSIRYPEYQTVDSRLKTFDSWPLNEKQDKKDLVICGFFYTGQQDIVRCFFCDIGLAEWDETDEPWSEHARHSPYCKYVKKFKGQDFISRVQQEWRKIHNPKAPHMQDLAKRVESFRGGQWPESHTQNPKRMAVSGFYYTDEEDAVRCHYCDGGLRKWESGDDPWTEHAHWFPFCKYLMKIKGVEFIDEVQQRYLSEQRVANESVSSTSPGGTAQEDDNPLCSSAALALLDNGYSKVQVQYAIDKFVAEKGHSKFKAEDLVNILFDMMNEEEVILSEGMTSTSREETDIDPEMLEEENQRLKEQLLCIKCEKAERVIVFIPCGHRVVCKACADDMKKCIHCKKNIQKKVKTYLS